PAKVSVPSSFFTTAPPPDTVPLTVVFAAPATVSVFPPLAMAPPTIRFPLAALNCWLSPSVRFRLIVCALVELLVMSPLIASEFPDRVNEPAVLSNVIAPMLDKTSLDAMSRLVPAKIRLLVFDGAVDQFAPVDHWPFAPLPLHFGLAVLPKRL